MMAQMNKTKQLLQGDAYAYPFDMMLVPTLYADGSILNGAGYILTQRDDRFYSDDNFKNPIMSEATVTERDHSSSVNAEYDITMSHV